MHHNPSPMTYTTTNKIEKQMLVAWLMTAILLRPLLPYLLEMLAGSVLLIFNAIMSICIFMTLGIKMDEYLFTVISLNGIAAVSLSRILKKLTYIDPQQIEILPKPKFSLKYPKEVYMFVNNITKRCA